MRQKYVVWVWKEQGVPRFVGWGRMGRNHPAKELWAKRHGADSDLNLWLRGFEKEPDRSDQRGLLRQFYKHEASSIAVALRIKYKNEGYSLLDSRAWGSYEGGGAARMVMSPDFTIFGSVRQAAVDEGVHPSTITRLCQAEGTGWDYLN